MAGPARPREYICRDKGSSKGCTKVFDSQEAYQLHIQQR